VAIRWRLHLARSPDAVFGLWSTDEGRAAFWCERSAAREGGFVLDFPNGQHLDVAVLESEPPSLFAFRYFDGSEVWVTLEPDGAGGCELTLTEAGAADAAENRAGWVNVLLMLKAACDHGVDLRNHDPARSWDQGYADA
jgi:uncharacterized protein YndB with AHSA1/START domain